MVNTVEDASKYSQIQCFPALFKYNTNTMAWAAAAAAAADELRASSDTDSDASGDEECDYSVSGLRDDQVMLLLRQIAGDVLYVR